MSSRDAASELNKLAAFAHKSRQAGTTVKIDGMTAQVGSIKDAKEMAKSKSFGAVLEGYVDEVNQLQVKADQEVELLAAGKKDNLHDVTIAMEEAETSFQMMMEIRNKLVDAYEELKRMQ